MSKHLLFIQGGGDDGYEADRALVKSLQENLRNEYDVSYPELNSEESKPDFGWAQQIGKKIHEVESDVILVGHSFGASMLLKYLSENSASKKIAGIFLIATPFWSGDEDWEIGLKLQENFADKLPNDVPIFFYHCQDDEEVPFSHFIHYKKKVTQATFREIKSGGHQLNDNLTLVATDIDHVKIT